MKFILLIYFKLILNVLENLLTWIIDDRRGSQYAKNQNS